MSKITDKSATSLLDYSTYKNNNTYVYDGVMYLHDSIIVRKAKQLMLSEDARYAFSLAGYNTKTTRDRINGVLRKLGYDARLFTKDGDCWLQFKHCYFRVYQYSVFSIEKLHDCVYFWHLDRDDNLHCVGYRLDNYTVPCKVSDNRFNNYSERNDYQHNQYLIGRI